MGIIEYCDNRGQLPDLIKKCRELRPHINWPDIPIENQPTPNTTPKLTEQKSNRSLASKKSKLSKLMAGFIVVLILVCCIGFYIILSNFSPLFQRETASEPIQNTPITPSQTKTSSPPVISTAFQLTLTPISTQTNIPVPPTQIPTLQTNEIISSEVLTNFKPIPLHSTLENIEIEIIAIESVETQPMRWTINVKNNRDSNIIFGTNTSTSYLVDENGTRYAMLSSPRETIQPGVQEQFELRFEPAEAGATTFQMYLFPANSYYDIAYERPAAIIVIETQFNSLPVPTLIPVPEPESTFEIGLPLHTTLEDVEIDLVTIESIENQPMRWTINVKNNRDSNIIFGTNTSTSYLVDENGTRYAMLSSPRETIQPGVQEQFELRFEPAEAGATTFQVYLFPANSYYDIAYEQPAAIIETLFNPSPIPTLIPFPEPESTFEIGLPLRTTWENVEIEIVAIESIENQPMRWTINVKNNRNSNIIFGTKTSTSYLVDENGTRYAMLSSPRETIQPGVQEQFELRFEPAEAGATTFQVYLFPANSYYDLTYEQPAAIIGTLFNPSPIPTLIPFPEPESTFEIGLPLRTTWENVEIEIVAIESVENQPMRWMINVKNNRNSNIIFGTKTSTSYLIDENGTRYAMLSSPRETIQPGVQEQFELRFEPAEAGATTFQVYLFPANSYYDLTYEQPAAIISFTK